MRMGCHSPCNLSVVNSSGGAADGVRRFKLGQLRTLNSEATGNKVEAPYSGVFIISGGGATFNSGGARSCSVGRYDCVFGFFGTMHAVNPKSARLSGHQGDPLDKASKSADEKELLHFPKSAAECTLDVIGQSSLPYEGGGFFPKRGDQGSLYPSERVFRNSTIFPSSSGLSLRSPNSSLLTFCGTSGTGQQLTPGLGSFTASQGGRTSLVL